MASDPDSPEPAVSGDRSRSEGSAAVSVIGGGLAGSLAALALARRGMAVQLIAPTARPEAAFPHPGAAAISAAISAAGARTSRPGASQSEGDGGRWMATALSYGSLLGAAAAAQWQQLEREHGPLGWQPAAAVLHGCIPPCGSEGPQAGLGLRWPEELRTWLHRRLPPLPAPLALSRVDGPALARAMPQALRRAGVELLPQAVLAIEPVADGWSLRLSDGASLRCGRLLLAAGAGCRALWPALPDRLQVSWAGVLRLEQLQGRSRWLEAVRRGWLVLPARLQRPELERSGPAALPRWSLDLGLAPWGDGALLGQISWLPPEPGAALPGTAAGPWPSGRPGLPPPATLTETRGPLASAGPSSSGVPAGFPAPASPAMADRGPVAAFRAGAPAPPPEPRQLERWLRQGLARLDPELAELEAAFHLVPVSYCSDGVPLAGALAPGLWVLAGCSNAYSHLPALAERLAAEIAS